jgi:hypothetical protein
LITGHKRTFFVLDLHSEYHDLLLLFKSTEVIWLHADEIGINPFEIPIGPDNHRIMSPEKWVNNIREWLSLSWLNEPSLNCLCEILLEESDFATPEEA